MLTDKQLAWFFGPAETADEARIRRSAENKRRLHSGDSWRQTKIRWAKKSTWEVLSSSK